MAVESDFVRSFPKTFKTAHSMLLVAGVSDVQNIRAILAANPRADLEELAESIAITKKMKLSSDTYRLQYVYRLQSDSYPKVSNRTLSDV